MTDNSLLQDFITETSEHLQETDRNLLLLGQQPDNVDLMNEIFRSIHTIKGSSEYLGLERISQLSHRLESLLDFLRRGQCEARNEVIELLINANDRIGQLVEDLDQHQVEKAQIDDLLERVAIHLGEISPAMTDDEGVDNVARDEMVEEVIYEDEYDEELFGIFLEQLNEGLQGLHHELKRLEAGEAAEPVLEQCADRLTSLRSSANYMGYEQLKGHYETWMQAVADVREQLAEGQAVDLGKFVQEVMVANIGRVKGFFPNVAGILDVEGTAQKSETASIEETVRPEQDVDAPEEKIDLDMSTQSLLGDFITETGEHLEETERNLIRLEQHPDDVELMNEIFRSIHTIKGSSEYLGLERIAQLSHKLESLLDFLRRGEGSADKELIELLINANDRIDQLVGDLDQHQSEQTQIDDLLKRIEDVVAPQAKPPVTTEGYPPRTVTFGQGGATYEETYDQELFEIFLNHMHTGLEDLRGEATQLTSEADPSEALKRCEAHVDRLRSSANYMEYEELREFYDQWLVALNEARTKLTNGEAVDLKAFVENTLLANITYVEAIFNESVELKDVVQPGDSLVEEALITPEETIEEALLTADDVSDESVPPQTGQPMVQSEDASEEANLMERLESAFDARMSNDKVGDNQSLPFDIEGQLLSEHPAGFSDDAYRSDSDQTPSFQHMAESEEGTLEAFLFSQDEESITKNENDIGDAIEVKQPDDMPSDEAPVETPSSASITAPDTQEDAQPPVAPAAGPPTQVLSSAQAFGQAEVDTEAFSDAEHESKDRRRSYQLGRRKTDKFRDRMLKQSIRVDAGKVDYLMNQVGELVVSRAGFTQIHSDMRELQLFLKQSQKLDKKEMQQVKDLANRISDATVTLGRVTAELQENVMKVRMLPIAQLFSRYPRLVHDLVRHTKKQVNLDVHGEDTELDKMVIEQIADPMVHIIRNAVDHGIEPPTERQRRGKSETGTLRLEAYHEGNYVVIEISDDGRGMDAEKIKAVALKQNFVSQEELDEMDGQEVLALIMRPGFSTAEEVTHTSGRGVGMDVVKDHIEKLSGSIDIFSTPGSGARFRIKIPLTLAIIPALMVTVANEIFTIPLAAVDETIRVRHDEISTIEGLEVIYLRDATIPLIRLHDVFKMRTSSLEEEFFVVIVNTGTKRVGFIVDQLRGREEVVIKPLEDYLQEKSGFSGATLLGDGSISLILDVFELVNLSVDQHTKKIRAAAV